MRYLILIFGFLGALSAVANPINVNDVNKYIGKEVTVCGRISEVVNKSSYTFINLGGYYPNHKFYFYVNDGLIINKNKVNNVCGYGKIELHNGKPQIQIKNSSFLKFNYS
jgi:hypothetical protein